MDKIKAIEKQIDELIAEKIKLHAIKNLKKWIGESEVIARALKGEIKSMKSLGVIIRMDNKISRALGFGYYAKNGKLYNRGFQWEK